MPSPEVSLPRWQRQVVPLKPWILGGLSEGTQTGSKHHPAASLDYLTLCVMLSISKFVSYVQLPFWS